MADTTLPLFERAGNANDQRTKTCNRCFITKPVQEFYRNKLMPDGRLKQCKECTLAAQKAYREANPEIQRARSQRRAKTPEKREANRLWTRTEKGRAAGRRAKKQWLQKDGNREKERAHFAVLRAVRKGRLVKPDRCEECGRESDDLHGHHRHGYDRANQLNVAWLCPLCHMGEHAQLRKAAE